MGYDTNRSAEASGYVGIGGRYGTSEQIDDIRIDSLTNALIQISYEHHEVHGGSSYRLHYYDASMADNETIQLTFKTPAGTKRIHMIAAFGTLVGGEFQILEGATWDHTSGSIVVAYNRKRETTMNTSIMTNNTAANAWVAGGCGLAQTSLAGGTEIYADAAFGVKNQVQAGGGRDSEEWILKPDTQYAIVFTANGGSNAGVVDLDWYEHTDKH